MTRLIDPSLEKLSQIMTEMGDMAIACVSLAVDSYLEGENTNDEVHDLSDSIRNKYFEVEDLILDCIAFYSTAFENASLIVFLIISLVFLDLV